MSKINPPFRADQVGSLLRPKELLDARQRYFDGEIPKEELRQVEDKAIREVIKKQEDVGLRSVTLGNPEGAPENERQEHFAYTPSRCRHGRVPFS